MTRPDTTLSYASPVRARRPSVMLVVPLALAIVPYVAFFCTTNRGLPLAIVVFGSLYSPVNFALSLWMCVKYRHHPVGFGFALITAIIAGINVGFLVVAIIFVAVHGIPC